MNKTFRKIVGGALAVTALMGLAACGSKTEDDKAEGKTYKVGIVQFVDDASLNQIEAAIEAELDAKAKELGVTFDYTLYNGQGDATTLNQIGAELVGKGVDLIVPIATPAVKIMQSATEDTEIPIVFSAVSDPVGSGIVDALDVLAWKCITECGAKARNLRDEYRCHVRPDGCLDERGAVGSRTIE